MADDPEGYTVGSGNVFADAGLPDADERLARAKLMRRITQLIKGRGLTQREAAELMGVPQPHISLLLRGRMSSFSLERLLHMLTALGADVTISYRPSNSATGRLTIVGDDTPESDRGSRESLHAAVG